MIKLSRIQDLFDNASFVGCAGNRSFMNRPIGRAVTAAARAGGLSILLTMMCTQGAGAGEATFDAGMSRMDRVSPNHGGKDLSTSAGCAGARPARFAKYWQHYNNLGGLRGNKNAESWLSRDGSVNIRNLLALWREGDITPEQAGGLIDVLMFTQSPVITRTEDGDDMAGVLANRTKTIFDLRSKSDAAEFLEQNSIKRMVQDGLLDGGFLFMTQERKTKNWTEALKRWQHYGRQRLNDKDGETVINAKELAIAKEKLLAATDVAGLSSLRVPFVIWEDPAELERLATNLTEANYELQNVTGWKGGVLGLNGRVNLQIGIPGSVSFTAPTGGGAVTMTAAFDDVGHEFAHALDYALRTTAIEPGDSGALFTTQVNGGDADKDNNDGVIGRQWISLQKGLRRPEIDKNIRKREIKLIRGRSGAYGALSDVDANEAAKLAMNSSPWLSALYERSKELAHSKSAYGQSLGRYLLSPHEILGYSLGAYVHEETKGGDVLQDAEAVNGLRGPDIFEARAGRAQWRATFALIGARWWTIQTAMDDGASGPDDGTISNCGPRPTR
jgi:hypothetical protein